MSLNRSKLLHAAALMATVCLGFSGPALAGHHNPVDKVSNPNELEFTDVSRNYEDFTEVFVRDGAVTEPNRFHAIVPGLAPAEVRTLLGEPLRNGSGKRGTEWDYNFKFLLTPSQNFIVCQYKVVFDQQETVREQVWRRRQCQLLAQDAVPVPAPS